MAAPTPDPIDQPHDALFRHVFGEPKHLASLLRAVLSPTLTARLDLDRLRIDSASFVSRRLERRASGQSEPASGLSSIRMTCPPSRPASMR